MKTSPNILALVLASLAALAPFVASNRAASAAVLTDMPPAGTPE